MDRDTEIDLFQNRRIRRHAGSRMSDPIEHSHSSPFQDHVLFTSIYEGFGKVNSYFDYEYYSGDEWIDEAKFAFNSFTDLLPQRDNTEGRKRKMQTTTNSFQDWVNHGNFDFDAFQNKIPPSDNGEQKRRKSHQTTDTIQQWVNQGTCNFNTFANFLPQPHDSEHKKRKSHPTTNTFQERLEVKKFNQSKWLPEHYKVFYKCQDNSTPSSSSGPQATHDTSKNTLKDLLERMRKLRIHTPKKPTQRKKLTQEELLEEAKITEIENLKSLERYKHVEIEKKCKKIQENQRFGPTITFRSRTTPLIEEVNPTNEYPTNIVTQESIVSTETETPTPGTSSQKNEQEDKCERTLITFADESHFNNMFPPKRHTTIKNKIVCPISGEQCKYRDPLTKIPFGNASAFRILRQDYHQQVVWNGYYAGPQVPQWIEFFQNQQREQNNINVPTNISMETSL